jgi:hypothetical protein
MFNKVGRNVEELLKIVVRFYFDRRKSEEKYACDRKKSNQAAIRLGEQSHLFSLATLH